MNKVIIITGAANGVGKAVATILKDKNLILIDEDKDNLVALYIGNGGSHITPL